MSRKYKYSYEEKLKICEDYFSGRRSQSEIAHSLGFNRLPGSIWRWIHAYQTNGADALLPQIKSKTYTKEFKVNIVNEYLSGKGSIEVLCLKHKISSCETLRNWLSLYNSNIELKDYDPKPEVYMASARRKTTIEERKDIVNYCLAHSKDYKGTAEKYEVSYGQVRSWVKKYTNFGEDGLVDKRGHHKSDEEMSKLDKLRRENALLKRQLEEKDMVVELLKKVKEYEGRRF